MKNRIKQPDFSKSTPRIQLKIVKIPKLYEKAFMKSSEKGCSDYSRNTTTWD